MAAIWKAIKSSYLGKCLNDQHHATLPIFRNKIADVIKQNWNQFLLDVKATVKKLQISKIFYIYERPLTDIHMIVSDN